MKQHFSFEKGKIIFDGHFYFLTITESGVIYETVYLSELPTTNLFFLVPVYRHQKGRVVMDLLGGPLFVAESDNEINEQYYNRFIKQINGLSTLKNSEWMTALPGFVTNGLQHSDE